MLKKSVLVVLDGLRRDMVTPDLCPSISALRNQGIWYSRYQSVFPSVTRVVSSSIATGSLPEEHGLRGNTIAMDEGNGLHPVNVGKPDFFARLRRVSGQTLLRPTLAQILEHKGGIRVYSNVSPGAAYAQDPDGHGEVLHRSGSRDHGRPMEDDEGISLIKQGEEGDLKLTDLFCRHLQSSHTALSVLWLSDPDFTGHHVPLGSPAHQAAIRNADRCVGQVAAALQSMPNVQFIVCSDHGQVTETETIDVQKELVRAGLKDDLFSTEVVVASNGTAGLIYLEKSIQKRAGSIANFLREVQWTQCVWASDEAIKGAHLESSMMASPYSPDLAFAMRFSDASNQFGIPGCSLGILDHDEPKERKGYGNHGGISIAEQTPFLLVCNADGVSGISRIRIGPEGLAQLIGRHLEISLTL